MPLHMPYAGYWNLQPLRHFGHTPGLYAYRGLPAFAFALHGRQRWRLLTRRTIG